ncbi:activin receptor type-2A [Tetranychus urticae]|uniref:Serine/threonine-protein kinase receptor n=1 Tax=Tetranychus urticae TaxID=32264 RepID=T1JVQ4_TETUR|nr:activin receptor type-2A [Tetranychus urticae]
MYISPAPPESFAYDPECVILNKACKGDGCLKETVNRCSSSLNDSYSPPYHCYVVWKNTTEGVSIELRGCVSGKDFTCSKSCIERNRSPKNGHFFCCCSTDLCNENFLHLPAEEVNKIELAPTQQTTTSNFDSDFFWISIYIFIPSIIILGIILILSWYQRNKSRAFNEELSNSDESTPINEQSFYRFKNLELDGEQSRGRFGAVWRARLPNESGFLDEKWVAVKIFPAHEKNSWLTEQQVFMLPKFEHKNILPFLGFEKRENDNVPYGIEYWIISEFHELGSLYDYLKSNTIEFSDFLKISEGIACGLAHLHDEIPSTKAGQNKPAIAHRDFKSKNVLLKSDLTPRIADFGLCLVFYPDRPPTDLGQVGTRRYMAPEVLEGAINFYRDAFTRIDIYAFGLVLWELISRCKGEDGTILPDKYMLPFEEEVGLNPTLEDMQRVVCQMKRRPEIKPIWRSYPATSQICETIEECWDQDAEARLSASCVIERISQLMKSKTSLTIE